MMEITRVNKTLYVLDGNYGHRLEKGPQGWWLRTLDHHDFDQQFLLLESAIQAAFQRDCEFPGAWAQQRRAWF